MSDTMNGGVEGMKKKIYGIPWKGKKLKSGYYAVLISTNERRTSMQVTKPVRSDVGEERHLVVFGIDDNTIYLNFLTSKENNNYDVYSLGKSGGVSCGAFIKSIGLKDGVYPVERVAPGVYKFDKDGVIK